MDKVWFITGASRGIGAEIAKATLLAGDKVVATGRNIEQLHKVYQDVPRERIVLAELDVAQEAQAEAAVQLAMKQFGRIDVLVNNAGYGLLGNFEEIAPEAIERQFATNVFGLMHVTRAVLPVMRNQRSGHIFNLSSIAGTVGFKGASVYCATKYAVEGFSASIALEVDKLGITLTTVEPGFFRTDFLESSSVEYGGRMIEDYAAVGSARKEYDAYNRQQPGDPAKLGAALVSIADMQNPPRQFLAGSDAIALATQSLQGRMEEIRAFSELSSSTDGTF